MPRHVGDGLRDTLAASQQRLAAVAAQATAILQAARDEFGPLAALADGAAPTDEALWGTKAFCAELTAPLGDDPAASAAQKRKEMKRARRDALVASLRGIPAPGAACHGAAALALQPRLMRWREALAMLPPEITATAERAIAGHCRHDGLRAVGGSCDDQNVV